MNNMNKVQLTLTSQEAVILGDYGAQFGYNLAKTIRHLISKTVEEIVNTRKIPTFTMSQSLERTGLNALEDYQQGKTHQIDDIDSFTASL